MKNETKMKKESVTISMILLDGTINGMITAEMHYTWTGHVISSPINRLGELRELDELKRAGVYILIGENGAYIGESMGIVGRWNDSNHPIKNDSYDRVVVVTDNSGKLTKSYTQYLEARLIELCDKAKKIKLDNIKPESKKRKQLPLGDKIDMENFLHPLVDVVLPTIRVDIFRQAPMVDETQDMLGDSKLNLQEFVLEGRDYSARAQIIKDEFVVLKGSKLSSKWGGKEGGKNNKERERLIDAKIIIETEDGLKLAQNHVFNSLSEAAAIICATESKSGPASWKLKDSPETTYKQWIEAKLNGEE